MRLYYAPNTISVAVAIALHEAGIDYEAARVDFKSSEQTGQAYLALNPKGRVPTLDTGDTLLTETGAILEYIADLAPDARLVPSDPLEACGMRSVMYYLASTMHVNHAHGPRGIRWADKPDSLADMAAKVPSTMRASADYLQESCLKGPYMLGEAYSLADPYAFVVCCWLEGDGVPLADFPALQAFMTTMTNRPAVQAVINKGMIAP